METLEQIRLAVYKYLIERHAKEKESAKPFYFVMNSSIRYIQSSNLYEEIGSNKFFNILFYGNWLGSEITYLTIDEAANIYLTGTFDAQREGDPEIIKAENRLDYYFIETLQNDNKVILVDAFTKGNSFICVRQFGGSDNIINSLDYFLDSIKPRIDDIVEPIRARYNHYFFNQIMFDDYLKDDPYFFDFSVEKIKRNLRLKTLRVQNLFGIKQLILTDLPISSRWIVLTGENGYGKTSVLQAIAAGLFGNYDENGRQLVPESAYVGVEYYNNRKSVVTNSHMSRLEAINRKLTNELATYGSSRLSVTDSVSKDTIQEQLPATYSLFNSDGKLLNVEQLFKDTYQYNPPFFNQLKILFRALIPSISDIQIAIENNLPVVIYYEHDKEGMLLHKGLKLGELASGVRSLLAMIGDLVYRLSHRQSVTNLKDLEGIVIIDEIELHLHPIYQKLLPEILSEQFPNLQFIVSTHSPIPLLGIPENSDIVLLNVTRTSASGIEIERLDVDFSVLTPNAILTSPIFGFKDLIPSSKPIDKIIQTTSNFDDILLQGAFKDDLNSFLTPEKQKELINILKD